jgi:hypothetical protein
VIAIERAPAVAPAASGAWWRTSSFGDMQAASAHELSTLGEHLQACRLGGGGLFSVGCGAQALGVTAWPIRSGEIFGCPGLQRASRSMAAAWGSSTHRAAARRSPRQASGTFFPRLRSNIRMLRRRTATSASRPRAATTSARPPSGCWTTST